MAALLALLSAVAYGAGDFLGGLGARRLPPAAVVLRSNAIGLVGLLVALPLVGDAALAGRDALLGAAGGTAGGVGVLLLYRGLALGTMSVVAPVTAVLAALVPVGVGLATGERPGALVLAGIPLALVAVGLLSKEGGHGDEGGPARLDRAVLLSAVGAGVAFGFFFVALDATGEGAGLWPVVFGRFASTVLFSIVAWRSPTSRAPTGAGRAGSTPLLLVGCGLLDAGANALFLLASHDGLLSVVGALGSLYPASTVLLARVVLGERLAGVQRAGMALAAGAVVLVSAG